MTLDLTADPVDLTAALVDIESVSGNEAAIADLVEQALTKLPLEVVRAVRAAWPAERPMSVRISADDWAPGGITHDEVVAFVKNRGLGLGIPYLSNGESQSTCRIS